MLKNLTIKFIKLTSPFLMVGALFLDYNFIYSYSNNQEIPNFIKALTIIGTLAVIVHFIEGIVAIFIAKRSEIKNPLIYGIYTFFVGTIGLFELMEVDEKIN